MGSRLWRPLLEGELAIQASEAVTAIAQALEAWSPGREPVDGEVDRDVFVVRGAAGQALFHGYLFKAAGVERHAARAEQLLDQALGALATTPMHPALYSGFTGIAWTVEHLGRVF